MPPAVTDPKEVSDVNFDEPATTKKSGRGRKSSQDIKVEDDVDDFADKNGSVGTGDEDGEDENEDEDEEVYVVEKIMSHMLGEKGIPLFEVKWEGYEKKSDRTWEPEENLIENASETLNEYLESIGGREKLFEESTTALKTKKRGRSSLSSTSQASGKRSRKNGDHPFDSELPLSAKVAMWKPPPGSWEDHIAQLDACEDEESGKLMVYLTWKNGQKTQHETSVIYQRCPQKMLQFYERHVRIIKSEDAEADSMIAL